MGDKFKPGLSSKAHAVFCPLDHAASELLCAFFPPTTLLLLPRFTHLCGTALNTHKPERFKPLVLTLKKMQLLNHGMFKSTRSSLEY